MPQRAVAPYPGKQEVIDNDLTAYLEIRPNLKTGDLLQWRGVGTFSNVIMAYTKQEHSHTSMVIRLSDFPDRVFSIEALSDGLHLWPLSSLLRTYNGHVDLNHLKPYYDEVAPDAARWLLARLGTEYDWEDVASRWRTWIGFDPEPFETTKLYCSESVFAAFRERMQDRMTGLWVGGGVEHLKRIEIPPVPGQPMLDLGLWQPETNRLVTTKK